MAKRKDTPKPTSSEAGITRPLVWGDLPSEAQESSAAAIAKLGNVKSGMPSAIAALEDRVATGGMNEQGRAKAGRSLTAMRTINESPEVVDRPITMQQATQSRVNLIQQSIADARSRSRVTGQRENLYGAGWYIQHRGLQTEATGGEMAPDLAATIGGKMSSGKKPEDERAGIAGVHQLLSRNHSITVHHTGASEATGIPLGTHSVSDLTSDQIANAAALAATQSSGHPRERTVTGSDHAALVMAGRPHKQNVAESINIIRHPDVASGASSPIAVGFNPAGTPKTFSYATSTALAPAPGSVAAQDYLNIAHHLAHGDPNQGMMLFHTPSEDDQRSEFFSPDAHTAEDTWMQAVDTGQMGTIRKGGKGRAMSVGKRVVTDMGMPAETSRLTKKGMGLEKLEGLEPTAVTTEGVRHAFGNEATRRSARAMGPVSFDQFGREIHMPAIMAQEVTWSQMRGNVGFDPEFKDRPGASAPKAPKAPKGPKPPEQLTLF
jgi:hypothetical protein